MIVYKRHLEDCQHRNGAKKDSKAEPFRSERSFYYVGRKESAMLT